MKTRLAAWAFPALVLLGGGVTAQDARPAPWYLTFSHGPLESHSLTYKDGSAETFQYFTFTLKNATNMDARHALNVKAIVDVGNNSRKRKTHIAVPAPNAEEAIRRLSRAADLKNVQQINQMKTLAAGASVRGIAVLGTFSREWDQARIRVSGLEPYTRHCRVRKYGDAGFTLPHRAYFAHKEAVLAKAGKDASFTEANAIVQHDVVWLMKFHREGDELLASTCS